MRRLRTEEAGFSLVELLIAILVLAIGIFALASTLDGSRAVGNTSERVTAASAVAQRQMEQVSARLYRFATLGMSSALTFQSGHQVRAFVCGVNPGDTNATFRWDFTSCPGTAPFGDEQYVVAGGINPTVDWTDARTGARGQIYTIITWVDDDCPDAPRVNTAACTNAKDYKRITVAVTVTNGAPRRPIILSTIAADPDAIPVGNQFTNPYTTDGLEY